MAMEHIVVINDDALYLEMMRDILTDEGCSMTACATSSGAVAVVEQQQPAAVILDMRMEQPDSGVVVLQQLRDNPRTAHVPVLVCSADVDTLRSRIEAVQHPHWCILAKPFKLDDLLNTLQTILRPSGLTRAVNEPLI
ncbi:MAG: response regulator [Herpetosiphonaceae bacterium]|nr:response regulator [Herpetosiphonaceae bacterium]